MSRFDPQRQESLKRTMWQLERREEISLKHYKIATTATGIPPNPRRSMRPTLFDDDLVAAVVPPVTVVLEGRSICQRISLHKHNSYESLARALRQMFIDIAVADDQNSDQSPINLSNAVPGHVIAYEDIENDLLLVGDLNWKDFVRVAKRIRILPAKAKSKKQNKEQ